MIATLVDAARLSVYGASYALVQGFSAGVDRGLIAFAILTAFGGALLGRRLLTKITVQEVRYVTGVLLLIVSYRSPTVSNQSTTAPLVFKLARPEPMCRAT